MNETHASAESPNGDAQPKRAAARRLFVMLAVAAVALGLTWALYFTRAPSADELLKRGRVALAKNDFRAADDFARQLLDANATFEPAILLAATAAERSGRLDDALAYYNHIPNGSPPASVRARIAAGEILLQQQKRLTPAEQQFRRAVEQDPDNLIAVDRLAFILSLETRNWEAQPWQLKMIRGGDVSTRRLYLLCLNDLVHADEQQALEFHHADPDDIGARLAMAEAAMADRDFEQAERLLRAIVHDDPRLLEAQVKLGRVLSLTGDEESWLRWHAALPEQLEEHPGLWVLRAQFANENGEREVAARCYWEAVERDPCHHQAVYGLGQTLVSLQRRDDAKPFLDRARQLQLYSNAVYDARSDGPSPLPHKAKVAAKLAAATGLKWEALAWTFLAEHGSQFDFEQQSEAWNNSIPRDMPVSRMQPELQISPHIDLSNYPLPRWPNSEDIATHETQREPISGDLASVMFKDVAKDAGVDFQYHNAADQSISGLGRVYEFTGGGAAVLDFDRDGWPDVYLTQGSRQPPQQKRSEDIDRLFRNLRGEAFIDATNASDLHEDAYSQGVSVGDVDSDGFPDVYVANLGENRLYRNNGDGTFHDVSVATGDRTPHWTTSCLVADINGDTWPDLYAVNYLADEELLTRVCRDRTGVQTSCLPVNFSAAPDQLLLNTGDGGFQNVTSTCGIAVPNGKGLGIVAADLQQSGRLSLFIANDGVPNFYFHNDTADPGDQPRFTEQALASGLALNQDGRLEACMGVAAGDADGDGHLDLFVTNFTEESNTFYRQYSGGLFVDETHAAGLAESSFAMLGFGTQFLDADLDGNLDLILTNGNVDDYRATGLMYHMPPQFFRNVGAARFVEVPAETLGPFFQRNYLGRGFARLDWNRDGRDDVVISHIEAPAALLQNSTRNAGNFLSVQLCGVESNRDAIGTIASLQAGGRTLVSQLTAGSGYQASNEMRLVFGLGAAMMSEELQIRWPSGLVQELGEIPANTEILVIEGRHADALGR